jgi:hypothetical protein
VRNNPVAPLRLRQHFGQQRLDFEDLNAALTHDLAEVVMLLLRLGNPEHVIEEQV